MRNMKMSIAYNRTRSQLLERPDGAGAAGIFLNDFNGPYFPRCLLVLVLSLVWGNDCNNW